jgi:hypothetical protein
LPRGKKGKIAAREWPAIIARHREGESLVSIARAYRCTPPAISYIVRRAGERASAAEDAARPLAARRRTGRETPLDRELRDRVHSDIASFIVAFEAAYAELSSATRVRLIDATDRLLRTGAHTRLALERASIPRSRSGGVPGRMQKQ